MLGIIISYICLVVCNIILINIDINKRKTIFYKTLASLDESIDRKMIIKTFEFIQLCITTLRRIQTKDRVDFIDIFVDIHIPTDYYITDTNGNKYVDIIERHLKGKFKKTNFFFTPVHLSDNSDFEDRNIFQLSDKGKITIYSFYFPEKPKVNAEKLIKEIGKLKKELTNKFYIDNNSKEFIKSKYELLEKKELELESGSEQN